MKRRNKAVHYAIILVVIVCAVILSFTFKGVPTVTKSDAILEEIRKNLNEFEEEPDDAYIDRVWKKTPGRNGLRVLVNESYQNMKKNGKFDPSLFVYEEVPPSVRLEDLPAAPIYRGHPEKMMVAFLINVSWGEEHLPTILKTLKEHDVKATFFIEGKWAKEHKQYVEMIVEQGHLIGNHAYNHPDMAHLSEGEIRKQISDTNDILEAMTDHRPKWFAPPSGSYNDRVVKIAFEENMETILWSVDTIDWKNPSVSVMINRVMKNIHPGAMILMHPTEPVAQGLSSLIEQIEEKNYKIDTVENLLSEAR
mgnify:CR=1 FL=1